MRAISVALLTAVCWSGGLATAGAGQTSAALQQDANDMDSPPAVMIAVRDAATQIFDAALLSNWRDADVAVATIRSAAADLPTRWSTPDLGARLARRIAEVENAVSARQRVRTLDIANDITGLIADLTSADHMPIPYALALLDYYGRELELGIAADDLDRLTRATADVQQTWNRFEPNARRLGADDAARRLTDSVAQLVGARMPADFADGARTELAAVDALKRLFQP